MLGDFLLASNYAGIAFGTAGCAAVHALSYPLGGAYHVPHGESNYAVFTGVMKNYLEIKTDGEISKMMDFIAALLSCEKSRAWDELEKLLDTILPKKPLRAYGVKPKDLPRFTEAVMTTQQRLMNNNFVPLDEARVLKIYKELYYRPTPRARGGVFPSRRAAGRAPIFVNLVNISVSSREPRNAPRRSGARSVVALKKLPPFQIRDLMIE